MAKAAVVAGLILTSLTTRSVVTVISAALPLIPSGTAPQPWAAILPALPLPAFALASLFAARLSERAGMLSVLSISAVTIGVAELVRASGSLPLLLIGTACALLGAAVQLAILPGVIYRYFPRSFGILTGVFVALMALTSAVASGSFVPLARTSGGWQGAVAFWAIPPLLAAGAWLVAARAGRLSGGASPQESAGARTPGRLLALMALLFGAQAAIAFTVMGWLPSILTAQGHSPEVASIALGAVLIVGLPASLGFSAGSQRSRRAFAPVLLSAVTLAGLIILPVAVHPVALVAAVVLLGVGSAIYPVVLVIISRAAVPGDLVRASAIVQGAGYALVSPVPFVLGAISDVVGWSAAVILIWPIAVVQAVLSLVVLRMTRGGLPANGHDRAESPVGTVDDN